jgi:hypothetical protein
VTRLAWVVVFAVSVATTAHAERPIHGSAGFGGSLLMTGDQGDRLRYDLEVDLEPHSRLGGLIAWRAFNEQRHGIVCAGLVFEAAAARPRLVVNFHGDVGADLDQRAPMGGGGLRATITVTEAFGVALDTGSYLVVDGIDKTRLVMASGIFAVAVW